MTAKEKLDKASKLIDSAFGDVMNRGDAQAQTDAFNLAHDACDRLRKLRLLPEVRAQHEEEK